MRVKQHRHIPDSYKLKSVTISQSPSGKYHASILYEYEVDIQPKPIESIIGLDFSMTELYISSSGEKPNFPRYYRKALFSNNFYKQKRKIARYHEHIANQRKDFLHKQSRQITNAYDCAAIESINMQAMSQALNFGKSVSDNGWGMFTVFLGYKLTEQGKQLIKINKWFPSSKTCSSCGKVKQELALSERTYICDCSFALDRDINAAINIRDEAKRILAIS